MAQQVLDVLAEHEVTGSVVRIVDHGVKPGLSWMWVLAMRGRAFVIADPPRGPVLRPG